MIQNEDMFDDIIDAEARFQDAGYVEGLQEGKDVVEPDADSFVPGVQRGAAIGSEIGFYKGYLSVLQQLSYDNERIKKLTEDIVNLLETSKFDDPSNETLLDNVEKVRTKFKLLTQAQGVDISYRGKKEAVNF